MASLFSRRAVPYVTGAAAVSIVGSAYSQTRRPIMLDSTANPPTKTLAFPASMLFSKQLTVTKSEQVNHDTKRITFALPGGDNEISGVPAGSAILTQHNPSNGWLPILRPYTPISDPSTRGTLELLVKRYPSGRASTHMHSLSPGDHLTVRGPLPGYNWRVPKSSTSILLVAGGAGITPIYSLAKGILSNANEKTQVQLLWGVNGERDIVLRDELERLEQQHPGRLQVTYCISGPDAKEQGEKWTKGYVDKSVLQQAIERCGSTWGDDQGKKVFLCGPPAMENAVGKTLTELGLGKKEVHKF
ncbi:hypothetical protein DOTSEDRAFT_75430 [Dothistroma septosporum NZE10]|uniref:NADH-cytochrome b5 reductase n=1 Tax=Dothistroma septosporum (strain NZE10 / CBS 128990) TaxID=675120 RepID=M2WI35_DOTSN|nr:hypothetical protein DOTSEDRAFT_75430 [Dothistroma septosporum NZE10]